MEGSIQCTSSQSPGGPPVKQIAEVVGRCFKLSLPKIKIRVKDGLSIAICHHILNSLTWSALKLKSYRLRKNIGPQLEPPLLKQSDAPRRTSLFWLLIICQT